MRDVMLLAVCLPAALAAGAQNPVTFSFAPADGATVVETRSSTTEMTALSKVTVVSVKKVRETFTKTTAGYQLTQQPQAITTTINGSSAGEKINAALCGSEITYDLDGAGILQRIDGVDALVARVKKLLTPEEVALASKQLDIKALTAAEKEEWHERVGQFARLSVKPGDRRLGICTWDTPLVNALPFYSQTTFIGPEQVDGRSLYRLKITGSADPAALAKISGKSLDEIAVALGVKRETLCAPDGISATYECERVVDLATLLAYSEKAVYTLDASIPKPTGEGATPLHIQETDTRGLKCN